MFINNCSIKYRKKFSNITLVVDIKLQLKYNYILSYKNMKTFHLKFLNILLNINDFRETLLMLDFQKLPMVVFQQF